MAATVAAVRTPAAVAALALCVSLAGCGGPELPKPAPIKHMPKASAFGSTIDETLVLNDVLDGNRILEKELTIPPKAGKHVLRLECLGKGLTWIDVRLRGRAGESSFGVSCGMHRGVQRVALSTEDVFTDKSGRTKLTVRAYGTEVVEQDSAEDEKDDAERFDTAPATSRYSIMLSYAS